jgi:DNA primase (bacterial type)
LEISAKWFQDNLYKSNLCKEYLNNRNLSNETIKYFKLGYSSNPRKTLYAFLKEQDFNDKEILESNVVKLDKNNKIRDFFYNRLIFPISNEFGKIVGFGGRVLDNSNPKYINSPESFFFKKRNILYNLYNSKQNIRSKKNMLICEGYMDVISLHDKNIKTAVAPLGTSLTDSHLLLSWKYVNKPTLMFDGDASGLKASFKSAIMSLPYLTPSKLLQFVILPN